MLPGPHNHRVTRDETPDRSARSVAGTQPGAYSPRPRCDAVAAAPWGSRSPEAVSEPLGYGFVNGIRTSAGAGIPGGVSRLPVMTAPVTGIVSII